MVDSEWRMVDVKLMVARLPIDLLRFPFSILHF